MSFIGQEADLPEVMATGTAKALKEALRAHGLRTGSTEVARRAWREQAIFSHKMRGKRKESDDE